MKKIYVGNLPYQTSPEDLQAFFADYEGIVDIQLIKDHTTGRSRGFGFVEFESPSQAQAATKMNGQECQGRPLKVSLAKEPERSERSGGGGGGDRNRGGFSRSFSRRPSHQDQD